MEHSFKFLYSFQQRHPPRSRSGYPDGHFGPSYQHQLSFYSSGGEEEAKKQAAEVAAERAEKEKDKKDDKGGEKDDEF